MMSESKNPPDGMARAYTGNMTGTVYVQAERSRCYEYMADGVRQEIDAEVLTRSRRVTPIPDWDDANWDNPPEFVMANCQDSCSHHYRHANGNSGIDNGSTLLAFIRNPSNSVAAYKRHPDHPEVLQRVWMREKPAPADGCYESCGWGGVSGKLYEYKDGGRVPLDEVPWDRVSGGLVPPVRFVVPEANSSGAVLRSYHSRIDILDNGSVFFSSMGDPLSRYDAAHYSIAGDLIGHRAADGGWREVWEATDRLPDGSGVTLFGYRERGHTTITKEVVHEANEKPEPVTASIPDGFTAGDMPKPKRLVYVGDDEYFHGTNGVNARRRKAEGL